MTKLFLAAGVAALAIAAPATAERGGGGQRDAKAERGGGQARAERTDRRAQRTERAQRPERSAQRAERPQRAERAERPQRAQRVERSAQRTERAERPQRAQRVERSAQRNERAQRVERRADRVEQRGNRAERQATRIQQRPERAERREMRVANRDNRQALRVERDDRRMARVARDDRRELRVLNRDDRRDVRVARINNVERRVVFADNDTSFNPRIVQNGNFRRLVDGCPPGLVSYEGACWPYGQYKKLMIGQVIPATYSNRLLPLGLRDYYQDDDDYYYRYGDNYVYRVQRDNNLISALLPLLGGGLGVGQLFPTNYMNSYVPNHYQSFYPDTSNDYYRYYNGNVYQIDAGSGYIEDMIPMYGYGYGVGQMMPAGYNYYNVPNQYRDYYYDTDDHYYRYAPGSIYQVDRSSNLITAVAALLGGGMSVGQPMPMGYDAYNVPYAYRDRYYDTPESMYRYSNGSIYQIDPTTRLVTALISAIV